MEATDLAGKEERSGPAPVRLYYFDWLRVIAIVGVWAYHSARPFMLQDWLINNAEKSVALSLVFLIFLGSMGMPLFFTLAGAGSRFALSRRSGKQFVAERTQRLLIPFVAGCILLSPVQFYLEWMHKGWYQGPFLPFILVLLRDRAHLLATTFSPRIFESLGSHLWFLGYLFTFSLIALPIFLWLKTEPGRQAIACLGKLGDVRGGLLAFIIPAAIVRMSLQPFFPGYTDWADYTYMLVFFVLGYVVYADERLVQAVRRDWQVVLAVGVLSTLTMLVGLAAFDGQRWVNDPTTPGFFLAWALVAVNGWCWTLTALALGMHALNFRNRWLEYGQTMLVPFYVLHQPPIVVIAFFVVTWETSIALKAPVVIVGSFLVTIALCELLVRRVRPARALLGIKDAPAPVRSG